MGNFHPRVVVGRGSETQLQLGEIICFNVVFQEVMLLVPRSEKCFKSTKMIHNIT